MPHELWAGAEEVWQDALQHALKALPVCRWYAVPAQQACSDLQNKHDHVLRKRGYMAALLQTLDFCCGVHLLMPQGSCSVAKLQGPEASLETIPGFWRAKV